MTTALSQTSALSMTGTLPVTITDRALVKVAELIQEEANFELKLRVFITGGGCSGFQYGFSFDEKVNADDLVITKFLAEKTSQAQPQENKNTAIKFLVDPMSLVYLMGAEIDYQQDLNGERFIIRNPNAKTTCGCGSSFTA